MSESLLIIDRLIECRKKLGISKMEAAKRIGVSQPAYLRYESGERTPSIQVIKEIASVLHTSPDYLTGKTDSPGLDTFIITAEKDPELFSFLKKYYDSEQEQRQRLLAYFRILE